MEVMLKIIPMKCASCGSALEITPEMTTFACGFCGVSQLVERSGGTISLRLSDAIKQVQVGTDKTAAELALKRLGRELENVEQEFHNMQFRRSIDIRSNYKVFSWLWAGGLVVCLIMGASGGGAAYFALFLGILGTAGVNYLRIKQDSVIKLRFNQAEKEILYRGNNIQNKIAENRRLVDS